MKVNGIPKEDHKINLELVGPSPPQTHHPSQNRIKKYVAKVSKASNSQKQKRANPIQVDRKAAQRIVRSMMEKNKRIKRVSLDQNNMFP